MQAEHVSNLGLQLFKPPCCGKQKLRACFEQGHQCTATGPPRNSHVEWAVGEFPHRKKTFPASVDRYLTSASLNESRLFMAQRRSLSGRGGKSRQRTLCCHSCREVGEIQESRACTQPGRHRWLAEGSITCALNKHRATILSLPLSGSDLAGGSE